ncbi:MULTISPECIES: hypothetical protein [Microbacterium]|uniref:Uncharacterized protein n=1 Tax=Microbacterium hominis TaxID=162426 RepID=A0A2K9DMH0_9MICO|nr:MULTISPECIES: hypothetical protein [Microbacterium]AUG29568.1 hypothetical protein CXR34_08975 [Microbacterium hominis]EPD84275.1 hypothetical protein HMPREF1529_02340 [Microbacterium sp. oral taxon 186 str. F0373]
MSVQTRIFTNHIVSQPGSPFQGALMLDDSGRGNLTLQADSGPVLTIDAVRLSAVIALLQECEEVRGLMTQTSTDLLIGEPDPTELL